MFDAEQEDREDEAVRVIQRKCRIFIARLRLIKLVRTNYIKKYDRINDNFYYKNKTTGATQVEKPVCLGMDDLADPRSFEAPESYDALDEENMSKTGGYCIAICNNEFPNSNNRIPKIPLNCMEEIDELENLLT
jgi:hypothetical protein